MSLLLLELLYTESSVFKESFLVMIFLAMK